MNVFCTRDVGVVLKSVGLNDSGPEVGRPIQFHRL
jgi:hypothetical protein